MESALLSILGLPLHPLVVHLAVIAVPVAAVLLVLGVVLYRRHPKILGFAVLTTWVAAVAAVFASQSGEALAGEIGITSTHEQWGSLVPGVTIGAAIVATLTWFVRRQQWRVASLLGTVLLIVAGPVLLAVVYLAGHSGAEATWGNTLTAQTATVAETPAPSAPAETTLPAPTDQATADTATGYTLADVATHNTVDDCWIVVDQTIYDASGYAAMHPGGAFRIADICGTDATDAFRNQHGTQRSPNNTLAGFELAPLAN